MSEARALQSCAQQPGYEYELEESESSAATRPGAQLPQSSRIAMGAVVLCTARSLKGYSTASQNGYSDRDREKIPVIYCFSLDMYGCPYG